MSKKTESMKIDGDSINEDMVNSFRLSMTPDAIPDMNYLMTVVEQIIFFIETEEMQKLEKSNKEEFEKMIYGKYNNDVPMKIIALLVDENRYENLEQLLDMFDVLSDIKNGKKDIQSEAEKFSEKQNQKYLYPKFGGKEQFEKLMKEQPVKNVPNKKKKKRSSNKILSEEKTQVVKFDPINNSIEIVQPNDLQNKI